MTDYKLTGAISDISPMDGYFNVFKTGHTVYNRVADAKAVTIPLQSPFYEQLSKIVEGKTVLDFGGAAGIDYFQTGRKARQWTVMELPETYKLYTEAMSEYHHFLSFTDKLYLSSVFHASGVIQYIESPFKLLSTVDKWCDYISLRAFPTGNKTFLSYQIGVGLSWVFNFDELLSVFTNNKNIIFVDKPDYPYNVNMPNGYSVSGLCSVILSRE